jgi:cell division protein FtsI/penicillin-binding protein 2
MAPYPHPKYVVVATAEGGGFGVQTAAPIVRQILATLFNVKNKAKVAGGSNLLPAGVNPYG